jgi:hypothetical protein
MKPTLIVLIFLCLISCKKELKDTTIRSISTNTENYTATTKGQKFGVLINAAHRYESDTYTANTFILVDSSKIKLSQQYGVKYYRLAITHDGEWDNPTKQAAFLTSYQRFVDSGFAILLNVKYIDPDPNTPIPFADSTNYRNFLRDVLDSISSAPPALVVVENEETNPGYYKDTTITDFNKYLKLLKGAIEECHARSIKITDGGLISGSVIPLVWDWLTSRHSGDTALTNGFARKALAPTKATALLNGSYASLISLGKTVMDEYATTSIDYINLHWYEPVILVQWLDANDGSSVGIDKTAIVPGVFDSVVAYLDSKFMVPILSNETGQFTSSSDLTNSLMDKYLSYQSNTSNFPIVCWYDGDGDRQYSAFALHNAYKHLVLTPPHYVYTFSLRTTGTAFQTKLQ